MLGFGAISQFPIGGEFAAPQGPTNVTLTPSLFTSGQTFYSATVTGTGGTQSLTASLFTNSQTFYGPTVGRLNSLTPSLYTNTQTFFAATVTATRALSAGLFTNSQTFYAPTVTRLNSLSASLYSNGHTFYSPSATRSNTLAPALVSNSQTFYAASISATRNLAAGLVTNGQTFYGPTARNLNIIAPPMFADSEFIFPPTVTATGAGQTVNPILFGNNNGFFAPAVTNGSVAPPAPITAGSVIGPRRRPFRPAILWDFEEEEKQEAAIDGEAYAPAAISTSGVGRVFAIGEVNAEIRAASAEASGWVRSVEAKSSWNDPTDGELIALISMAF
jgi:hypothetical protein